MKKLFHNRTALGMVSIVLGLLICFGLAPAINKASNNQTQIVRVVTSIPEGTQIKKEMIRVESVGGYNLPTNVLKTESDVVGKFTTARLDPGDTILKTKISDKNQAAYLSDLDGKNQAISISIKSFAAGLSGKLQSGDIVSLIVSDYGDSKQTIAPNELKYVKLLAATTAKGTDTDPSKDTKDKSDSTTSDSDNIPSTLTLLATSQQSTKLVDYETHGKLYAVLVYRGDAQTAKEYLDKQDEYLNTTNQNSSTGTASTTVSGGAFTNAQ